MPFIVKFGSKQYTVEPGQKFVVDRLNGKDEGEEFDLDVIHSYGDTLSKNVKATVLAHQKGKKIRVVKYKSKSNYHKQYGYRHYETIIQVASTPSIILSKEKVDVDEKIEVS